MLIPQRGCSRRRAEPVRCRTELISSSWCRINSRQLLSQLALVLQPGRVSCRAQRYLRVLGLLRAMAAMPVQARRHSRLSVSWRVIPQVLACHRVLYETPRQTNHSDRANSLGKHPSDLPRSRSSASRAVGFRIGCITPFRAPLREAREGPVDVSFGSRYWIYAMDNVYVSRADTATGLRSQLSGSGPVLD